MNRVNQTFTRLMEQGAKGLMPFVCGGYPSLDATAEALIALSEGGASVIEVGVPYSDPIADGPVIAKAMQRALEEGCTPPSLLERVEEIRTHVACALVAMCSVSIVHRMGGAGAFARLAAAAGFDGLIVPDVVVEEADELRTETAAAGLTLSLLVAPTTPTERAGRIAHASTGFVYLLARAGVTGESAGGPRVGERVASLRRETSLPIACGFGIATAKQVREALYPPGGEGADAVIVGSAVVRAMGEAASEGRDAVEAAASLVENLSIGLQRTE